MSTTATSGDYAEAENSASVTALAATADHELRVPCYCEENVWRLTYRKVQLQEQPKQYYAVFVSNPSKCVCFFQQRANDDPLTPVFWDYHVLLFERDATSTLVLDVDSYLPYPCPLSDYLDRAFPTVKNTTQQQRQLDRVAPWFRVVPADLFLKHFSSDRSHMWDETQQKWLATPPTYDCIRAADSERGSNLMTYVDMTTNLDDSRYGCVLTRQQLKERFL